MSSCDGTNPLPLDRRIYSSAERGLKIGDPARVVQARPIQLSEFKDFNSFHGCVFDERFSEFSFHFLLFYHYSNSGMSLGFPFASPVPSGNGIEKSPAKHSGCAERCHWPG